MKSLLRALSAGWHKNPVLFGDSRVRVLPNLRRMSIENVGTFHGFGLLWPFGVL